jgi:hypothetical protein
VNLKILFALSGEDNMQTSFLKSKFTFVNLKILFALSGEDNMQTSFLKSKFILVNIFYDSFDRLASFFACSNNDATYFGCFADT